MIGGLLRNMVARAARRAARLFAARSSKPRAPEILSRMRLSAATFDVDAFADGADELMDDSVRLMYNAKISVMTPPRRREAKSMTVDETASWLYDMCMDSMAEMPPLKVRMMLSAACTRHAGRVA